MTIKKYLTTPEEILALKESDTKIYVENIGGYYKFIQGVLFYFQNAGVDFEYQSSLWKSQNPYILEEEPVEEITEKDRGKLFKFINKYETRIGVLSCFTNTKKPVVMGGDVFDKCSRLTPTEVAEITGYKVEEK